MKFKLEVQDRANVEVAAATRWYRAQSVQAARGFVSALSETYNRLKKLGDAYRPYVRTVRVAYLKKYPYLVAYIVVGDTLRVLSVLHTSQDRDVMLENLAP